MRVEQLLKRFKREFLKINILQAALDSLIFFLSLNLVLFLFSVQLLSGFNNLNVISSLTFVFFGLDFFYRSHHYQLEMYEAKNPELREKLRTARDNLDRQNIVSQALFDEVVDTARKVTSESIIPSKKIINKIIIVGALSFLTVFSGLANIQLDDTGRQLIQSESFENLLGEDGEDDFELKNSSEIYGEREEINLDDMDTSFNITGSGTQETDSFQFNRGDEQELMLDTANIGMDEELNLAKEYSLRIRELAN